MVETTHNTKIIQNDRLSIVSNLPSTEAPAQLKNIHQIQAKISLPVFLSLEDKKYIGHIEGHNAYPKTEAIILII